MVPGGAAGASVEEGGKNALHVRVDIGSLEVIAIVVPCMHALYDKYARITGTMLRCGSTD